MVHCEPVLTGLHRKVMENFVTVKRRSYLRTFQRKITVIVYSAS